jgi:light-harvesting protein B-800-850 alpha chain
MNNAKMWMVVSPNIGIPLFLGAVAVGSFSVHLAVLNNTTWVADFLAGRALGSSAPTASVDPTGTATARAAYNAPGAQQVVVTMPDGSTATAVLVPAEKSATTVAALN